MYGRVLSREDGHVLRMALYLVVEGQKEQREAEKQVEEESVKAGLRMEDALCRSK